MLIIQSVKSQSKLLLIVLLCSIMSVISFDSIAQQEIRVQGTIRSIPYNEPISYVNVVLAKYIIAESDIDGKFVVNVPRDAQLQFSRIGHNDIFISVDGRQHIDVTMTEEILEIDQITVVGKFKKMKLTIEPTDLEVRGSYFYCKTRFRIPSELFRTDYRFVVQPTVYDVTKKVRYNFLPVVIDGKNYSITQHRYLNFDNSNDKLHPYIVENNINNDNEIYSYADSMHFDKRDIDNEFRVDCFLALVSCHKSQVPVLMDTLTIANGLQNVMRFFTYSLGPMNLNKTRVSLGSKASLTLGKIDSMMMPAVEMQIKNTVGTTYVEFKIGKSEIDYENPLNKKNIDTITTILDDLQNDKNASIKAISIVGYASPDGNVVRNQKLADRRTKELFNILTETISDDMRQYMTLSSKGVVESWSRVVDLIEQDSLPIAKKLRRIVTTRSLKDQEWAIRCLPEYRTLIVPHYLPKLRKIDYNIEYSVFRKLSYAEIVYAYNLGEEISRFEYFQLILFEPDDKRREQMEDDAIKTYPNFAWVINRVAIRLLLKDEYDLKLQVPVMDEKVPMSMVYNQALMAIKDKNIVMADSLVRTIEEYSETTYIKAVINALSGNYIEAFPVIAEKGGLNEIILLLGLKYNNQAYDKIKNHIQDPNNSQDAKVWYLYALCANRVDDIINAMSAMRTALKLDPSLAEIAQLDSDLMDIYKLVEPKKKENYDE